MDLKDKRALITGGTSGMGIATALAMAEKGASVIITGRDETRGASTERRSGRVDTIAALGVGDRRRGHDRAHHDHDLFDCRWIGRVLLTLISGWTALVVAGHSRW